MEKSMQISTCMAIKENTIKMMTRWYITPKKLSKINNSLSDRCWKCKTKEETFYHMWWGFKRIKAYWSAIHVELQKKK